jgi:hypothetical protein
MGRRSNSSNSILLQLGPTRHGIDPWLNIIDRTTTRSNPTKARGSKSKGQ